MRQDFWPFRFEAFVLETSFDVKVDMARLRLYGFLPVYAGL